MENPFIKIESVQVSNRIQEALKNKGIVKPTPELVRACGFNRKTFASALRNELHPTIEQLVKLSIALDTDLTNLFEIKQPTNKTN